MTSCASPKMLRAPSFRRFSGERVGYPDSGLGKSLRCVLGRERSYAQFQKWLAKPSVETQLATLALNAAFGAQDGKATVHDPVANDWPAITALIARVSALSAANAEGYRSLLEKLNGNTQTVTPSSPAGCGNGF